MGKDDKEPPIDFGLLILAVLFVALGLSPAYMGTFLSYAPCLNGIPFAENILNCTGSDYHIGSMSVSESWASFLAIGIVLGVGAFMPAARVVIRILFIIGLVLWALALFGLKFF